jgi:hypothetical protein
MSRTTARRAFAAENNEFGFELVLAFTAALAHAFTHVLEAAQNQDARPNETDNVLAQNFECTQ